MQRAQVYQYTNFDQIPDHPSAQGGDLVNELTISCDQMISKMKDENSKKLE